jgi:glycosyltransferase involved in cell wall biosynthesis
MGKTLSKELLRNIAWEIGQWYPIPSTVSYIALHMVHPRLGHVNWHVREEEALRIQRVGALNNAKLVVRVYDVTDILFNGLNAHTFFDLEVNSLSGNYYFRVDRLARNYLAEVGFLCRDGSFHFIVRSNTAFFELGRPSGNYKETGIFVRSSRVFPVESIFDAPVYERMNRELKVMGEDGVLSIAVVFLGINDALGSFIKNLSQRIKRFGGDERLFMATIKEENEGSPISRIQGLSETVYKQLCSAHEARPFHIIHCHDWYSSSVGLIAAKELNLPLVLTLHSTEHERTQGRMDHLSLTICELERKGVREANLVIVPHSSTRQQVIDLYGASPEKVVIISDAFIEGASDSPHSSIEVRRWFGLNQEAPVVLFAGEISHAAGADILMDALPTVCRNHGTAQFLFAGDGPLKGELEAHAWHLGIGNRCRFLGDLSRETFEALLMASDFVVIPARTWQDEGLARMAISCGKPVLTTHQARIKIVRHGENGLVTFDNPGSIVWGIQELLVNPLQGNMLRIVARKRASEITSLENIAAQHYMYYAMVIKSTNGIKHA